MKDWIESVWNGQVGDAINPLELDPDIREQIIGEAMARLLHWHDMAQLSYWRVTDVDQDNRVVTIRSENT